MSNEDLTKEYRDEELCTKCGGKCCWIYRGYIWRLAKMSFKEWKESIHGDIDDFGIKPYFNSKKAWYDGTETEKRNFREELKNQGIDPTKCEYAGSTGCIIPWENRPVKCKTFTCDKWETQ